MVAGFATTLANAAGPVMNLYLLARRLPKQQFIATGAWFFLVINLSKLPIYAGHGLIHTRSLLFDLVLVPPVLLGAAIGRRVAARLPQQTFELLVLALTSGGCRAADAALNERARTGPAPRCCCARDLRPRPAPVPRSGSDHRRDRTRPGR